MSQYSMLYQKLLIIVVMSFKENIYTYRRKNKENFTITADVTNILRTINANTNIKLNNNSWKNNTQQMVNVSSRSNKKKQLNETQNAKIAKNSTNKTKTLTNKPNLMTQADIDKLFNGEQQRIEGITSKKIKVTKCNKIKTQTAMVQAKRSVIHNKNDKLQNEQEDQGLEYDRMQQSIERRLRVDFTECVQFLKVQDSWDKLLSGISKLKQMKKDSNNRQLDQEGITDLFNKYNGSTQPQSEDKNTPQVNLTQQFKKNFLVGKVIGQGAYASVRIAIYKPYNKKVAIKIYEKNKIKQLQRKKSIRRQIKILQILRHPNIVKIYDVIQTNNHLNIIMEYLDGISLNAYLKSLPGYQCTQKNCKRIIKPLIEGLKYLHQRNIAHRDIKLENIILDQNTLQPKLIDFGFSTCIEKPKKVKIFCGTPSYMSPEIIQKKQYRGQAADIWAIGVIFYVTLTGNFPFKGSTDQELYKKINNAEYLKFDIPSKQAADLINKMLRIDPEERITASQILNHPWMGSLSSSNQFKKGKKTNQSIKDKKTATLSSHKQKEQGIILSKTMIKKLTQTCKQNLRMELKIARKSPSNINLNNTMTKKEETNNQTCNKKLQKSEKYVISSGDKRQKMKQKVNPKVLDLLRVEMKKKQDDKEKGKDKQKDRSKGKNRRI